MTAAEKDWKLYAIVLAVAAIIYLGCIVSPPSLMDDVDAVQSQIARNMLSSGDWVTPRIDGVLYFEKAPMNYWMMAVSYLIFGEHDWAARLPHALSAIALAWLTMAFGTWAFGRKAGFYAGLCMATCVGLFLFTRIQIPDVTLTLCVAFSLYALLRALEEEEARPGLWASLLAVSLGIGLLLKSLIGVVFPLATGFLYLLLTKQLFAKRTRSRLHPIRGFFVFLLVAAPWHVLATLRNPPYWSWTIHSGPGQYHGFLWFFFVNEQVLRYLNLRYPHDYNTVPRLYFWLFHLVWLFPWCVYFPAIAKLSFKPVGRAGRTRLLALCWVGFVLVFFTLSTTQEYYSMPCYPALALLLGAAMASDDVWLRIGTRILAVVSGCAAIAAAALLWMVRNTPTPGDIATALTTNPEAYTLALGHMEDLTIHAFAYLRLPLAMAAVAFLLGALGTFRWSGEKAFLAASLMMILFFHAARTALVVFDPLLSSRPLAEAIRKAPGGELILDGHYYEFSSVPFYLNRKVLLLNGANVNLAYGSAAPNAPPVFLDDSKFKRAWLTPARYYLVADGSALPQFEALVGRSQLHLLAKSAGKVVLTNQPTEFTAAPPLAARYVNSLNREASYRTAN
jgi:4-amino-4-deoxy-L-arabinose transferase-like glycosyltransferase